MTGVYLFKASTDAEHPSVKWIDVDDAKTRFGRALLSRQWRTPEIRRIDEYETCRGKPFTDRPLSYGRTVVLSDRAIVALRTLLEPSCEILPLKCDEGTYWAVNVVITTPHLELHKCECEFFRDGSLWNILVHQFQKSVLEGPAIFRLPIYSAPVCVLDEFVSRCREHELTGCVFQRVWQASE